VLDLVLAQCANLQFSAYFVLDHRALNLNHAQIVILNLFQDNKQLLRVILKQVQDDDDSDIQHDALAR
jgi:hypothetical protein